MILDILSVPPVYSRLLNNPLCTLLYEEITRSPDDWEDVRNISECMQDLCETAICHVYFRNTLC